MSTEILPTTVGVKIINLFEARLRDLSRIGISALFKQLFNVFEGVSAFYAISMDKLSHTVSLFPVTYTIIFTKMENELWWCVRHVYFKEK